PHARGSGSAVRPRRPSSSGLIAARARTRAARDRRSALVSAVDQRDRGDVLLVEGLEGHVGATPALDQVAGLVGGPDRLRVCLRDLAAAVAEPDPLLRLESEQRTLEDVAVASVPACVDGDRADLAAAGGLDRGAAPARVTALVGAGLKAAEVALAAAAPDPVRPLDPGLQLDAADRLRHLDHLVLRLRQGACGGGGDDERQAGDREQRGGCGSVHGRHRTDGCRRRSQVHPRPDGSTGAHTSPPAVVDPPAPTQVHPRPYACGVDLDVVFLGTGGSVPSARRNTAALMVRRGGDRLLFDCGEGTQRQMQRSTGLVHVDAIFITHLHADHYLGLPGLIKSYEMLDREERLPIYGPPGLRTLVGSMSRIIGKPRYGLDLVELNRAEAIDFGDYEVEPFDVSHQIIANGYALREDDRPGRFDPEAARTLGVEPGPAFGELQDGRPVRGRDGTVEPEQVMGPDRPGQNVSQLPEGRQILDAHLDAHSGSDRVKAGAWQYYFASCSESGFLVILQVSRASVMAPVQRILHSDVGVFLATMVVMLAALGLVTNRLLRPIPILLKAIDRAEQGQDPGRELHELSRRRDEFGTLARGFEEMIAQVHEREKQLIDLGTALELNERRIRALVENATDILMRLDAELNCLYVSPALKRDLGHDPEALLGKPLSSLVESRDHDRLERALSDPSMAGRLPFEVRVQDAGGQTRQVEVTILRHTEGESVLVGLRDVTERERARQLQLEADAAEAANRAKSAFLANMSHELRTPLNAIIGYSEILMEEAPDSGLEDFLPDLERIHTSGKNLLTLINDILDLSKIDAGKMPVYPETFELQALIRELVREVEGRRESGVELRVEVPPEPILLYSDKSRVRQCLLAILDNACKFTHEGHIEVRAQEAYGRVSVEVQDSGIGIKPEQLERLWAPFSQGDSSATRKYGGTGLGLLLTRRIVELIGGEVFVQSTPQAGSTFTIELPLHSSMADEVQKVGANQGRSRRIPRVLVIDDDPQVLELMRRTLEKEGFEVAAAGGGPEGLRKAREWRPDAITLDVMMPEVDGWTVLGQLKADPDLCGIPVVLVTFAGDRGPGLTLGAAEQIEKPIQRDRLVTLLQRLCPAGPGRVLVVEDDPSNRELLQRTLSQEGWSVETAENGRQAIERMQGEPTRLVLLDLMMPEVDGFEVLAVMHQNPRWASVPVVVVTAKELTDEEREYLHAHTARLVDRRAFSTEELVSWLRQVSA
ncbi:response regulator, partial [bacterium CPR1]|nr:response regulator [bacterium CPR1]